MSKHAAAWEAKHTDSWRSLTADVQKLTHISLEGMLKQYFTHFMLKIEEIRWNTSLCIKVLNKKDDFDLDLLWEIYGNSPVSESSSWHSLGLRPPCHAPGPRRPSDFLLRATFSTFSYFGAGIKNAGLYPFRTWNASNQLLMHKETLNLFVESKVCLCDFEESFCLK